MITVLLLSLFISGSKQVARNCDIKGLEDPDFQNVLKNYSLCTERLMMLEPGQICQTKYNETCVTIYWGDLSSLPGELQIQLEDEIVVSGDINSTVENPLEICSINEGSKALVTISKGTFWRQSVVYAGLNRIRKPKAKLKHVGENTITLYVPIEQDQLGAEQLIYAIGYSEAEDNEDSPPQPIALIYTNVSFEFVLGDEETSKSEDTTVHVSSNILLRNSTEYEVVVYRIVYFIDQCFISTKSVFATTGEWNPSYAQFGNIFSLHTLVLIFAAIGIFLLIGVVLSVNTMTGKKTKPKTISDVIDYDDLDDLDAESINLAFAVRGMDGSLYIAKQSHSNPNGYTLKVSSSESSSDSESSYSS